MLIGIDGNEANLKRRVGSGQFAYNLLVSLHKVDKKNKYIIYLKDEPLADMPSAKDNWQYFVFGPDKFWTLFALPLRLITQDDQLDVFFSPSHYTPSICPFPCIPTIHDLGYLSTPDQFTKKDYYQLVNWTKGSLSRASHIAAVSNFSKSEINRIYNIDPKKISIVYNGIGKPPLIDAKDANLILEKFKITKPYFLCLGTLKPNKNISFLIKSFSRFLSRQKNTTSAYQLVIAGKKGWLFDDIFKTVKEEAIEDKIVFTDYIDEIEKWALYQNAYATILPSTYEGFGIPALESMKFGTPVIVSNIPPFEEVVAGNGLIFDLAKKDDLLKKMLEITDPKVRSKYSRLGRRQSENFSWDASARALIKVFEKFEK